MCCTLRLIPAVFTNASYERGAFLSVYETALLRSSMLLIVLFVVLLVLTVHDLKNKLCGMCCTSVSNHYCNTVTNTTADWKHIRKTHHLDDSGANSTVTSSSAERCYPLVCKPCAASCPLSACTYIICTRGISCCYARRTL